MAKYHINDRGNSGRCFAREGHCPFGDSTQHYGSKDEARAAYEKQNQEASLTSIHRAKQAKLERWQSGLTRFEAGALLAALNYYDRNVQLRRDLMAEVQQVEPNLGYYPISTSFNYKKFSSMELHMLAVALDRAAQAENRMSRQGSDLALMRMNLVHHLERSNGERYRLQDSYDAIAKLPQV